MLKIVEKDSGQVVGHLDGDAMCIKTHNSDPQKSTTLVRMSRKEIVEARSNSKETNPPIVPEENDLLYDLELLAASRKSLFKNAWFYVSVFLGISLAGVSTWHLAVTGQLGGTVVEKTNEVWVGDVRVFQKSYHREVMGRVLPAHKTEVYSEEEELGNSQMSDEVRAFLNQKGVKVSPVVGGQLINEIEREVPFEKETSNRK